MSYFRSGDPLDDFARREREQAEWVKQRPKCAYCKEHIQDERLMVIEGELYHLGCAEKLFGDDTDYYSY